MNIHGKNNSRVGTIGEQVLSLDVLSTNGDLTTLTPADTDFYRVVSGAGLVGVITRVRLQMKRVHSGLLRVLPLAIANWDEHFEAFERYEGDADYMVSWVDCFGKRKGFGRGQFHAAWYMDEPGDRPASLLPEAQDLPSTILGLVPKSIVWKFLKPLNNRVGMGALNAAKFRASSLLGDGKPHPQSLVGFSFLLDYVPDWRKAYLPGGFLQYQSFVPRQRAPEVFARQVEMQQEAKLESFLGVLKRHRPDGFLLSHAVNGYSLALDFKITERNRERLLALAHQMNELVLEAGGRFYLAKDSTLRPEDLQRYLGDAAIHQFREARATYDPEGILTSHLAERLHL
jgi:decaprenylphospho-beta-D-ribofuranose 2-oxidase